MKTLSLLTLTAATALSCENPFGYSYIAETIKPGKYELACLPLKILGADGAPCRAVLRAL